MPGSQTITAYRYENMHTLSLFLIYVTCFPTHTQTLKPSLSFLNGRHPEFARGLLTRDRCSLDGGNRFYQTKPVSTPFV